MSEEIEPVYRLFGQELKRMRLLREFHQDELASFIGLSRVSICNIEEGRQRVMFHDIIELVRNRVLSRESLNNVVNAALKLEQMK